MNIGLHLFPEIVNTYEEYFPTGAYGKKTISAQDCEPRTEIYEYDATQRFVTKVTNPLNHEANFTYDPKTGNKLTETDVNGLTTSYAYDAFGNLIKTVYPDGTQTIDTIYWHTDNIIPNACYYTKTTSTGKPTVEVYYDVLGREVCRMEDDVYFDTRYNAIGQIEQTSYPYVNVTTPDSSKYWCEYTYDNFGRKLTETAPYTELSYEYDSREVAVKDHLRNVYSSKDYDPLGRIVRASDAGGDISYNYMVTDSSQHETTIKLNNDNNTATTIVTDLWGNRLSISDPHAGTITSSYNKFNELVKQTDASGYTATYEYDKLGRVTEKVLQSSYECKGPPLTITYIYDNFTNTNKGKGKLHTVEINGTELETFTYDALSRLAEHDKAEKFKHRYTYNADGQLDTLIYPSGFGIKYNYTNTGKLLNIKRSDNNNLIYEVRSRNIYQAPRKCAYGNGVTTDYTYNPYGWVTRIHTHYPIFDNKEPPPGGRVMGIAGVIEDEMLHNCILDYKYTYNNEGLMSLRTEEIINHSEAYTYDKLDRLTEVVAGAIGQAGTPQTFSYQNNGNITNNSNVGIYTYNNNKPYAVAQIETINNDVIDQYIEYNNCSSINQPGTIIEGDYWITLSYDDNQQRISVTKNKNSQFENTRDYFGKYYEIEINSTLDTIHYHYIYGDNGAVALYILNETTGADSMYYIHTDHLGSYCTLTDAYKKVRQRSFFDPWGNVITHDSLNFTLTRRGFTGHEHYTPTVINMIGRLYDPTIGRFYSPDNFVQIPELTQSYNRYSYCLSNPLRYIDPTGQRWVDVDNDWIPEVDKNGNVTYTAEQGDNHYTFTKQFYTDGKSKEIFKNAGLGIGDNDVKIGTVITGDAVRKAIGTDILKGDWSNMTKGQKAAQILFAVNYSRSKGESSFNLKDFANGFQVGGGGINLSNFNMPTTKGDYVPIINLSIGCTYDYTKVQNYPDIRNINTSTDIQYNFNTAAGKGNRPMIMFTMPYSSHEMFDKLRIR